MNVNKRIGKWKQWTGEKLGQGPKTEISEDLQELQEDVALRRSGVDKVYEVSKQVSKHLSKKVEAPDGSEDGKIAIQEAFGGVFATHGDEFGGDSAFGQALRIYGRAHQDVASAGKDFQGHFNDAWLSSLERDLASMNDYDAQCKKLGSRRLTYDAMLGKVQKSKKEKADLEADLRLARNRYEETSKDVQERAMGIQAAEGDQLAAVTKLLEAEYAFVERYKQILDDVRSRWPDRVAPSRRRAPTMTHSNSEPLAPAPTLRTRPASDEDDDDGARSKPGSVKARSRSSTLTSKFRGVTGAGATVQADEPSKPPLSSTSRFGGIRIPGLPGGTGSGSKDYATMQEEDDLSPDGVNGSHRHENLPPSLRRTHTSPPANRVAHRVVEAKWDYTSSQPDELQLRAGDRVLILDEINPDWYTGRSERTGQQAMFPSAFVVPASMPSLPPRSTVRKGHFPPTPPEEHEPAAYIEHQPTGRSDVSDAFADHYHPSSASEAEPDEGDDDDEGETTALRPNGGPALTLSDRSPSSNALAAATRGIIGRPPVSVGGLGASAGAKRPPPPPPPIRRAHSSVPHKEAAGAGAGAVPGDDGSEAYGNVSELKKRLGMAK